MGRGATVLAILFSGCIGFVLGRSSAVPVAFSPDDPNPTPTASQTTPAAASTPPSTPTAGAGPSSTESTGVGTADVPAPEAGSWTVNESSSPMDDSRTVTLHLSADGSYTSWTNDEHTPSLIIRCKENQTDLFVVNGTAANPELGHFQEATVRLRIDNAKPYSELWSESTDNEALFAPRPISLARRLGQAERLTYQFTPFNSSPVTVTFTVRGLDQHLPKLASGCRWPAG
jgi:type VI secretion system protein VasI